MGRDIFATSADLQALSYYSDQQRADVLACYLLDPNRYSMQEVAEMILRDNGSQAGQRVSLITRCYGFSSRNAGRYSQTATRGDIQDFVHRYHPERCGGLRDGTFDEFLRPRLEARQRQQQADAQRQQERLQREEQRRADEARRQQELRRMEEQRRMQEERLRQAELQRQRDEQRRFEEMKRQELRKKQQAEQIAEQAASWWRKQGATLQDVVTGIQMYQKALGFSWEEFDDGGLGRYSTYFSPSSEYFNACAWAAEQALQKKDFVSALTICQYLCDYRPNSAVRDSTDLLFTNSLDKNPNRIAFGRGYRVRVQIYLDPNNGYYNEQLGAEAARMGGLCGETLCLLRYTECLEYGRGVKKDLWAASSLYSELEKVPQFREHACAKVQEIGRRLFQESTAEVARCLEKNAPDAFPMVGHDTKDWNIYQQTVLDLPALWESYQKEHSQVTETGVLFKKKHYLYLGKLSEEQFRQCCKHIWSQRRQAYATADYQPCPSEAGLADALFQQGMEQFRSQQFIEASSTLKLPAACGYLQAQKALVQIYSEHIRKPQILRRLLELLAASADPNSCEDLARGYVSLGQWDEALRWTEKAGDRPEYAAWRTLIRRQAENFLAGVDQHADTDTLMAALRVCQRLELNSEKRGWLAWMLAKRMNDDAQRIAYLNMAADNAYGPACYDLACLEISIGTDKINHIINLLETADAQGALPDRELLAAQYFKKQDFTNAAGIYVQLEQVQDVQMCLSACQKARSQMPSAFSDRTENQHRLAYKIYQTILKFGSAPEKLNAQYSLAMAYLKGYGTEPNPKKAHALLRESAAGGYGPACRALAIAYLNRGNYEAAQAEMQKCTSTQPEYQQLREKIAQKLAEQEESQRRSCADAAASEAAAGTEPGKPASAASEKTAASDAERTISQPSGSRKEARQVQRVQIGRQEYAVNNATDAVTLTFTQLLCQHPDRLEDCLRSISQLTTDSDKSSSVFRQKKRISTPAGDVWPGVSTGFELKCAMTDRLCQVLGLPAGTVCWCDTLHTVYRNSERGK